MPRRWPLALSPLALALALLGCTPEIPEGRFACTADEDCPPEMVCRTVIARCYRTPAPTTPPPDAGD